MIRVKANSKAKVLVAGQEYLVTKAIAEELERKGWIGEEPKPKRTRKKAE